MKNKSVIIAFALAATAATVAPYATQARPATETVTHTNGNVESQTTRHGDEWHNVTYYKDTATNSISIYNRGPLKQNKDESDKSVIARLEKSDVSLRMTVHCNSNTAVIMPFINGQVFEMLTAEADLGRTICPARGMPYNGPAAH